MNTWNVLKVVIGKYKICNDNFQESLDVNKEKITDKELWQKCSISLL